MRYLNRSFTLPAGSTKISQEEWDRIFGKKDDEPELGTVQYAAKEIEDEDDA